jgi:hypothetical protein
MKKYLLCLGFIIGLAIKIFMLPHKGPDMDACISWGDKAMNEGMYNSFHGIYFPLQYHIFELVSTASSQFNLNAIIVFKIVNLVFDSGNFFLIFLLLWKFNANILYSLLYWLHPWFLTLFFAGYIDYQFSFFILLTLLLLRNANKMKDYFLAGLPFAAAFLMKPQAQILILSLAVLNGIIFFRNRNMRSFSIFISPTLLFLLYMLYFTFNIGGLKGALILPYHYINVTNVQPALTAQMLNIWYPIAYFMRDHGPDIFTVRDDMRIGGLITFRSVAAVVTLFIIIAYIVRRVQVRMDESFQMMVLHIFAFASIVVPFFMTSAHENHFFLGSVLLILLLHEPSSLLFKIAIQGTLFLQFIHLYSLYGAPEKMAIILRHGMLWSIPSIILFSIILIELFKKNSPEWQNVRKI